MRSTLCLALTLALGVALGSGSAFGAEPPASAWTTFAETDTIRILTEDEDGSARETKIWIVVLDGAGYVRTNDSRWLANIRRGSAIEIRAAEASLNVAATEVEDEPTYDRVEEGFKAKYGTMQKIMSFFRMSTPTVLRLDLL
jgi:hypothetical protein